MRMQDKNQALEVVREVEARPLKSGYLEHCWAREDEGKGAQEPDSHWFHHSFGGKHPVATALRRTDHVCPSLTFEIQST